MNDNEKNQQKFDLVDTETSIRFIMGFDVLRWGIKVIFVHSTVKCQKETWLDLVTMLYSYLELIKS